MKPALVNQRRGLGDVLFCVPLARHFLKKYGEVIWPVDTHYLWVSEYIPEIKYVDASGYEWLHDLGNGVYQMNMPNVNLWRSKHGRALARMTRLKETDPIWQRHNDEAMYYGKKLEDYYEWYNEWAAAEGQRLNHHLINLRFANHCGNPHFCMFDKYRAFGLNPEMYRELSWKRNIAKEEALFTELNLGTKKYNLVNRNYEWPIKKLDIQLDNGLENIYMDNLPGYTMLDWAKVIENASEIHTTSTSTVFPIETLTRGRDIELHLYPRSGDPELTAVGFLEDRWIKHV